MLILRKYLIQLAIFIQELGSNLEDRVTRTHVAPRRATKNRKKRRPARKSSI